jgi:hypothetical protein
MPTPVSTSRPPPTQNTRRLRRPIVQQETPNDLHRQIQKTIPYPGHLTTSYHWHTTLSRPRVDPTLLPIANELTSQQANASRRVLNAANRALSYCAMYSNNQIVYHACDTTLHVFAHASYVCRSHSRSVAEAIFFLGNHNDPTRINGSSTSSLLSYLAS